MVYRVFHHLGLGAIPMPENLATSLHITVLHTIALPTSKNSRRTSAEQKSPTQKPWPRFKPVFSMKTVAKTAVVTSIHQNVFVKPNDQRELAHFGLARNGGWNPTNPYPHIPRECPPLGKQSRKAWRNTYQSCLSCCRWQERLPHSSVSPTNNSTPYRLPMTPFRLYSAKPV